MVMQLEGAPWGPRGAHRADGDDDGDDCDHGDAAGGGLWSPRWPTGADGDDDGDDCDQGAFFRIPVMFQTAYKNPFRHCLQFMPIRLWVCFVWHVS